MAGVPAGIELDGLTKPLRCRYGDGAAVIKVRKSGHRWTPMCAYHHLRSVLRTQGR